MEDIHGLLREFYESELLLESKQHPIVRDVQLKEISWFDLAFTVFTTFAPTRDMARKDAREMGLYGASLARAWKAAAKLKDPVVREMTPPPSDVTKGGEINQDRMEAIVKRLKVPMKKIYRGKKGFEELLPIVSALKPTAVQMWAKPFKLLPKNAWPETADADMTTDLLKDLGWAEKIRLLATAAWTVRSREMNALRFGGIDLETYNNAAPALQKAGLLSKAATPTITKSGRAAADALVAQLKARTYSNAVEQLAGDAPSISPTAAHAYADEKPKAASMPWGEQVAIVSLWEIQGRNKPDRERKQDAEDFAASEVHITADSFHSAWDSLVAKGLIDEKANRLTPEGGKRHSGIFLHLGAGATKLAMIKLLNRAPAAEMKASRDLMVQGAINHLGWTGQAVVVAIDMLGGGRFQPHQIASLAYDQCGITQAEWDEGYSKAATAGGIIKSPTGLTDFGRLVSSAVQEDLGAKGSRVWAALRRAKPESYKPVAGPASASSAPKRFDELSWSEVALLIGYWNVGNHKTFDSDGQMKNKLLLYSGLDPGDYIWAHEALRQKGLVSLLGGSKTVEGAEIASQVFAFLSEKYGTSALNSFMDQMNTLVVEKPKDVRAKLSTTNKMKPKVNKPLAAAPKAGPASVKDAGLTWQEKNTLLVFYLYRGEASTKEKRDKAQKYANVGTDEYELALAKLQRLKFLSKRFAITKAGAAVAQSILKERGFEEKAHATTVNTQKVFSAVAEAGGYVSPAREREIQNQAAVDKTPSRAEDTKGAGGDLLEVEKLVMMLVAFTNPGEHDYIKSMLAKDLGRPAGEFDAAVLKLRKEGYIQPYRDAELKESGEWEPTTRGFAARDNIEDLLRAVDDTDVVEILTRNLKTKARAADVRKGVLKINSAEDLRDPEKAAIIAIEIGRNSSYQHHASRIYNDMTSWNFRDALPNLEAAFLVEEDENGKLGLTGKGGKIADEITHNRSLWDAFREYIRSGAKERPTPKIDYTQKIDINRMGILEKITLIGIYHKENIKEMQDTFARDENDYTTPTEEEFQKAAAGLLGITLGGEPIIRPEGIFYTLTPAGKATVDLLLDVMGVRSPDDAWDVLVAQLNSGQGEFDFETEGMEEPPSNEPKEISWMTFEMKAALLAVAIAQKTKMDKEDPNAAYKLLAYNVTGDDLMSVIPRLASDGQVELTDEVKWVQGPMGKTYEKEPGAPKLTIPGRATLVSLLSWHGDENAKDCFRHYTKTGSIVEPPSAAEMSAAIAAHYAKKPEEPSELSAAMDTLTAKPQDADLPKDPARMEGPAPWETLSPSAQFLLVVMNEVAPSLTSSRDYVDAYMKVAAPYGYRLGDYENDVKTLLQTSGGLIGKSDAGYFPKSEARAAAAQIVSHHGAGNVEAALKALAPQFKKARRQQASPPAGAVADLTWAEKIVALVYGASDISRGNRRWVISARGELQEFEIEDAVSSLKAKKLLSVKGSPTARTKEVATAIRNAVGETNTEKAADILAKERPKPAALPEEPAAPASFPPVSGEEPMEWIEWVALVACMAYPKRERFNEVNRRVNPQKGGGMDRNDLTEGELFLLDRGFLIDVKDSDDPQWLNFGRVPKGPVTEAGYAAVQSLLRKAGISGDNREAYNKAFEYLKKYKPNPPGEIGAREAAFLSLVSSFPREARAVLMFYLLWHNEHPNSSAKRPEIARERFGIPEKVFQAQALFLEEKGLLEANRSYISNDGRSAAWAIQNSLQVGSPAWALEALGYPERPLPAHTPPSWAGGVNDLPWDAVAFLATMYFSPQARSEGKSKQSNVLNTNTGLRTTYYYSDSSSVFQLGLVEEGKGPEGETSWKLTDKGTKMMNAVGRVFVQIHGVRDDGRDLLEVLREFFPGRGKDLPDRWGEEKPTRPITMPLPKLGEEPAEGKEPSVGRLNVEEFSAPTKLFLVWMGLAEKRSPRESALRQARSAAMTYGLKDREIAENEIVRLGLYEPATQKLSHKGVKALDALLQSLSADLRGAESILSREVPRGIPVGDQFQPDLIVTRQHLITLASCMLYPDSERERRVLAYTKQHGDDYDQREYRETLQELEDDRLLDLSHRGRGVIPQGPVTEKGYASLLKAYKNAGVSEGDSAGLLASLVSPPAPAPTPAAGNAEKIMNKASTAEKSLVIAYGTTDPKYYYAIPDRLTGLRHSPGELKRAANSLVQKGIFEPTGPAAILPNFKLTQTGRAAADYLRRLLSAKEGANMHLQKLRPTHAVKVRFEGLSPEAKIVAFAVWEQAKKYKERSRSMGLSNKEIKAAVEELQNAEYLTSKEEPTGDMSTAQILDAMLYLNAKPGSYGAYNDALVTLRNQRADLAREKPPKAPVSSPPAEPSPPPVETMTDRAGQTYSVSDLDRIIPGIAKDKGALSMVQEAFRAGQIEDQDHLRFLADVVKNYMELPESVRRTTGWLI